MSRTQSRFWLILLLTILSLVISLPQEINYTVMTEDELKFRKNRRDPFILQVLSNSRVMLVGDEQELVS